MHFLIQIPANKSIIIKNIDLFEKIKRVKNFFFSFSFYLINMVMSFGMPFNFKQKTMNYWTYFVWWEQTNELIWTQKKSYTNTDESSTLRREKKITQKLLARRISLVFCSADGNMMTRFYPFLLFYIQNIVHVPPMWILFIPKGDFLPFRKWKKFEVLLFADGIRWNKILPSILVNVSCIIPSMESVYNSFCKLKHFFR